MFNQPDIVNYNALRLLRKVTTVQETVGSQSVGIGTWVTLVNITGAGWLYQLRADSGTSTSPKLRVTIDGGTAMTFNFTDSITNNTTFQLPFENVRFDSSIKIEYQHSEASTYIGTAYLVWGSR